MKKILLNCLVFILISGFSQAQYTKGGSEKNYERHRVSYDSVVTERKVPIDQLGSGFVGFTLAFAKSTDKFSRSQMTQTEFINSPSSPYEVGKMGLNNGFAFGFNFQTPIRAINKNLIRNIDVGLNWKLGYTSLGFDWKEIYDDPNMIYYEMFENATYSNFGVVNFGVGPSVTLIHNPDKPFFYVDLFLRFNANIILGGNVDASYEEYYSPYPSYELDYERETAKFGISPTIGVNFRVKNFMFFIENNFGLKDGSSFYESFYYDDTYTYSSSYSYQVMSDKFKLANLQFGLGVVF